MIGSKSAVLAFLFLPSFCEGGGFNILSLIIKNNTLDKRKEINYLIDNLHELFMHISKVKVGQDMPFEGIEIRQAKITTSFWVKYMWLITRHRASSNNS